MRILAIIALLTATAYGQVEIHQGGDMPPQQQSEINSFRLLVIGVNRLVPANNFMEAQTKRFSSDDNSNTFGSVKLNASGLEADPILGYAALGAFVVTQETALNSRFDDTVFGPGAEMQFILVATTPGAAFIEALGILNNTLGLKIIQPNPGP